MTWMWDRRRPRGRLIAVAVLLAAVGGTAAVSVAQGLVRPPLASIAPGTYTGAITDPDGEPSSYSASLHIAGRRLSIGRVAGSVRYRAAFNSTTFAPALACAGTLRLLGRAGARFRFRETIAGGAHAQCISGGTVTLTRDSRRVLTYAWTMRGFTDPAPTGRLTRKP